MSIRYGCPLLELFVLFYFIIILWLVRGGNKGEKKGGFDDGYFWLMIIGGYSINGYWWLFY